MHTSYHNFQGCNQQRTMKSFNHSVFPRVPPPKRMNPAMFSRVATLEVDIGIKHLA